MHSQLAAIDLGSNTFRLAIANRTPNQDQTKLIIEDQSRELVSLAKGLGPDNQLDDVTMDYALEALSRLGQKLHGIPAANIRAVATNTFRVASNIDEFLPRAEAALGCKIEIISGTEEARLIYTGVAQSLKFDNANRFVMDIGGGSTEFIIGSGLNPTKLQSLGLGCTTWTRRFFPNGSIHADNMQAAINAARDLISQITTDFKNTGWQYAYGSSGTAKGIQAVLQENNFHTDVITLAAMQQLKQALIAKGHVYLQDWKGLKQERAPLLAGGLAILIGAFEELGIDNMSVGDGALRVGILYDMLEHPQDYGIPK